jgi:hypothetical protein
MLQVSCVNGCKKFHLLYSVLQFILVTFLRKKMLYI